MLQKHSMVAVGAGIFGVVEQPAVVARKPILDRIDHAGEFTARDPNTLLTHQGAHRVELKEAGNDLLGKLDVRLDLGDARIVMVGLGLGHWARLVDLPRQRRAQLRILGEQVVEDRGAGPRLTDDDDGTGDLLGRDIGILFPPIDYTEAVRQRANQVGMRDFNPDHRKPRLVHQAVDKHLQAWLPAVVAEIVESGLGAGGGNQLLGRKAFLQGHFWSGWTGGVAAGGSGLSSQRSTTKPGSAPPVSSQWP